MDDAETSRQQEDGPQCDLTAAQKTDNMVSTGHQYAGASFYGHSTGHLGDVVHHHHYHNNSKRGQSFGSMPTCIVPFRRDRDFVKPPIFEEIYECACQPAARVGVVGLGGIGKTQLAIEYAYRRRAADPQLWVFWVHASSTARFEQSYRMIAEQVRISGWADPKADVLSLVYAWLSDARNGRWTMIVDNADDSDVVFGSNSTPGGAVANVHNSSTSIPYALSGKHSIAKYLPSSAHASILITSRHREVVEGLIEYAADIFDVKPMLEHDAVVLLEKKLKRWQYDGDQAILSQLANELDHMPLAITQAAAYINQPGPRMTVSKYSEQLTRSDLGRDQLLSKGLRDPRRDGEASNSVIITWHASFERIRQTRPTAARLLSLMSLFDREGIPQRLLREHHVPDNEHDQKTGPNNMRFDEACLFDDDMHVLYSYDLVTVDVSEELFEMHRLVQYSTRKWLELHNVATDWQEKYISIMESVFPTGDHTNWLTCHPLFPHVEQILDYEVQDNSHVQKRAMVMYRGAWYAREVGRYAIARKMAETSLVNQQNVRDQSRTLTLEAQNTHMSGTFRTVMAIQPMKSGMKSQCIPGVLDCVRYR